MLLQELSAVWVYSSVWYNCGKVYKFIFNGQQAIVTRLKAHITGIISFLVI